MHFIHLIKKKMILALAALSAVTTVMAQDATATAEKTVSSGNNQLVTLLVIVMVVLLFVIGGLGYVLVALGQQVVEKNKQAGKVISALFVTGLLLASQTSLAQDTAITETVKTLPNYGGLSSTTFYLFVTVISMEVIAILFLVFSIRRIYEELLPQKEVKAVKGSKLREWWSGLDKKVFTRATPVEKEADILLDHDYDGIRELDNSLPPWWKYGFYITIGIAFIYLLNFHVLGLGKNPTEEYIAEMENARIEKEIFDANNKDKIDENNVPMADAAGIKAGEQMFEANCIACHLKGGGGNVGPNLTDDYWIHKGSLNDIYNTIKNGYPDKGMQSWITKFNPKEISQLASYIRSLRGTKPPNAKLPQGEMYIETNVAPVMDSAKLIRADSVSSAKKDSVSAKKP